MKIIYTIVIPLLVTVVACDKPIQKSAFLSMNGQVIQAELAVIPHIRNQGLMFRTSLPENAGMLFAFPQASKQCMWMKDTLIPLSVAFLDDRGRIVNIAEMQPNTIQTHCSEGKVRYALEMNANWFQKHGGHEGVVVSGITTTPEPY